MPNICINENGVEKLLTSLDAGKAAGPDELPPRVLKELASPISLFLTDIFQQSINTGSIPDQWKTANIIPIFKKGDKTKASNYRPVSLTCISCK